MNFCVFRMGTPSGEYTSGPVTYSVSSKGTGFLSASFTVSSSVQLISVWVKSQNPLGSAESIPINYTLSDIGETIAVLYDTAHSDVVSWTWSQLNKKCCLLHRAWHFWWVILRPGNLKVSNVHSSKQWCLQLLTLANLSALPESAASKWISLCGLKLWRSSIDLKTRHGYHF